MGRGAIRHIRTEGHRAVQYRLLLREDNADQRLTEKGRELGLVDDARWAAFCEKREAIERQRQRMASTWIQPNTPQAEQLAAKFSKPISHEYNLLDLLKRPELGYADLADMVQDGEAVVDDVAEQIEIGVKYAGYIERQKDEIERLRRHEETPLPLDFDYSVIEGLSNEIKLTRKPESQLSQLLPVSTGPSLLLECTVECLGKSVGRIWFSWAAHNHSQPCSWWVLAAPGFY